MIYFISAGPRGPIKIGRAQNVEKRLAAIRTSNAADCFLMLALDRADEYEQEMHAKFADLNIKGEWFRRERLLLDFIRERIPQSAIDVLPKSEKKVRKMPEKKMRKSNSAKVNPDMPAAIVVRKCGGLSAVVRKSEELWPDAPYKSSTVWDWMVKGYIPPEQIIRFREIGEAMSPKVRLPDKDFIPSVEAVAG